MCLLALSFFHGGFVLLAQNCIIPIKVIVDDEFCNIPQASQSVLFQTLERIATDTGLSTDLAVTSMILTTHVDVLEKSVLPGPPSQNVVDLGITLYIADNDSHKKFASEYIEIHGVGTGETKTFNNAFRQVKLSNAKIKSFIAKGRKSMMEYYDTQYRNIIKEVELLTAQEKYAEAISVALSVPVCSTGGEAVQKVGLNIYNKYRDKCNIYILNNAKAIWAASQDFDAANEAAALLASIDPESSCYGQASAMLEEIKKSVRSDIDFEMREKYHDSVKLEQQRIECMKAVGTAYGNGQKESTTNLMWLK